MGNGGPACARNETTLVSDDVGDDDWLADPHTNRMLRVYSKAAVRCRRGLVSAAALLTLGRARKRSMSRAGIG